MYGYVDAALVRAAACPAGLALPAWPRVTGETESDAAARRDWIAQVWRLAPIVEAVELASPVLARRIEQICAGQAGSPKQIRRAAASLHRYLLRLRHRSTPFGLFAGIAPARIGPHLKLEWLEEHRPFAQVDAVWLAEVVIGLEGQPELLERLPVVADNTGFVRDGRWVLPCQRPGPGDDHGPGEFSMRHTRAVAVVLAAATGPVPFGELMAALTAEYPDTPAETLRTLLTELVSRRVLLTSLHPPMTATDPLGHLIGRLDAADAHSIPAVEPTVRMLHHLRALHLRHTAPVPGARRSLRAEAVEVMRTHTPVADTPLGVNLRLRCSLTLPRRVAEQAAKAAGALARLTPFPTGSPSWQDFHVRFLERYGTGTLVPLPALTDPGAGLGLPAGYRGSQPAPPPSALTERDMTLLSMAQSAALDGAAEITFTDADLTSLGTGAPGIPLPHVDLRFRIEAATREAVDDGDFTLVVTGVSPAAGSTAGRFLDLLDPADRNRMRAAYARLPTVEEGALRAQVSSPPLHVRTENVGRAPAVGLPVIPVAEHHDPSGAVETMRLEDLAVTADHTRLSLVQISTGRTIEPTVLTAVDLTHFTHPLARLLVELPRARSAAFGLFAWGAAARLPYLPRIRYGRAVLAPATWRLAAAGLPGPDAPLNRWTDALHSARQRLRMGETVQLGDGDMRLTLDLDRPVDAALLRAELDRTGQATLTEAPGPDAHGWFDGRPHEITLALASTALVSTALASTAPASTAPALRHKPAVLIGPEHGHLPGASPFAYCKLYAHPDRLTDVLTGHLDALWEDWDRPPPWWFGRYRDPDDHLRLRFALPRPDAFAAVAARVGTWAAGLRRRGLIASVQWDTYYPETGRYGTGPAMTAAEQVFAADSAAALAQLGVTTRGGARPQAVTAAGLVDLTTGLLGDTTAAMRWLVDRATPDSTDNTATTDSTDTTAGHPDRGLHREAMKLADPAHAGVAIRELPGGARVLDAWAVRREALAAYRDALAADGALRPETVLPSLLHMHHIRACGIDRQSESVSHRLARQAAVAFLARREGAPL